ncbi:MAG: Fur family transcriptional regulator [Tissierellia bacterium]|nr:Fur family transcriptional regulator [Tissierellia bacterium]
MIDSILEKHSLKKTKTRRMILNYLLDEKNPVSAEDIYHRIKMNQNISMSTVYRNLNTFLHYHLVIKVTQIDGMIYYQFNHKTHEHLLICTNCNEMIPIQNCPLGSIEDDLIKNTGYDIQSHLLEFRGLCPKCQEQEEG